MKDRALRIGEVSESGMLSLPGVEPILVAALADAFNSYNESTGAVTR